MHLYKTLQHEIGLKLDIVNGLGHLGTKVIQVAFRDFKSLPVKKNSLIAATTSELIIDQEALKKSLV